MYIVSISTEHKILERINRYGGRLYRVGGCVRDAILGVVPKDIDYLVTGLSLENIRAAIAPLGSASEVGRSFGIVTARIDGGSYDFAMPRLEQSTGEGHKDFDVVLDPDLPIGQDLARRDFTMNAIAYDVANGCYIDPFHGEADLRAGIIRAVRNPWDRFTEDPLRILRAIQFASRFGCRFQIEEYTKKAMLGLCSTLLRCYPEQIQAELHKAFIKSEDTAVLCHLLDSPIGKALFGDNFQPAWVLLNDLSPEERDVVGFISLFGIGAPDLSHVSPTAVQLTSLSSFRAYYLGSAKRSIYNTFRTRESYSLVASAIQALADDCFTPSKERVVHDSVLPLFPKELALSGQDLMAMGVTGKQCGIMQKTLLDFVYLGLIKNDHVSLRDAVSSLTKVQS